MSHFVYVLYSEKHKKIYIGYTASLEKRVESHNHLSKKGWTIKYRPWILLYSKEFSEKKDALAREKQLKTAKGRESLWQMIDKG